jgi:hypothetical protein
MFLSCRYLSCNSSLRILIWILICHRMIGLRHMKSSLWLAYHMFWNRNVYTNTSCSDAPVPPHFWSWDVSTIKRLTSNNQDTWTWPLMLTTIALTRVWVIILYMYEYWLIWHLQVSFLIKQDMCRFFQWIDRPEVFNINIILFPYDRNESSPFRSFKRWVPPPPNLLPMTDVEKDEVSARHVRNPLACNCGYRAELVNCLSGWITHRFFVVRFL